MIVLRLMLKGISKVYFKLVLSSLIDEKSNCQRYSGNLAIKYKLGLRLFLFFTSKAQNVQCVAHSVICVWAIAEKIQTEGLRIENSPEIFHFFTLPQEIPDKTKAKLSPQIFHRIALDPLEIPRPKTKQSPGTSTLFFLGHSLEIPFCV